MDESFGRSPMPARRSAAAGAVAGNASFVQTIDFTALDDRDPSIADGCRVIYDREVPFELRAQEEEEGQAEAVRAKVLISGESHAPDFVRVELGCESDLFFHYTHQIDEAGFRALQGEQRLMVDFQEYPHVLIRMLNSCIKDPSSFLAVFVLQPDNYGRVDFMQNAMYKFLDLLSIRFEPSPGDVVRQQIHFRYNTMKARLALMQQRLNDVYATVKVKHPSLLLQLQQQTKAGGALGASLASERSPG